MNNTSVLQGDERAALALRALYSRYGYTQYKMNKFEEYDLYVQNKDFLISDHIILGVAVIAVQRAQGKRRLLVTAQDVFCCVHLALSFNLASILR